VCPEGRQEGDAEARHRGRRTARGRRRALGEGGAVVPAHDPLIVGPRGQTPQLCPSPSQALPNTALPTSALSHLGPSHLAAAQGRGSGACPRPTDRWPCEQTPRSPCTRTRASPPAQVTHSQSGSGTPAAPGGSRGRPRRTFSRRDTAPAGQQRMLARKSSRLAVSQRLPRTADGPVAVQTEAAPGRPRARSAYL
jgi:hypothetical protein